MVLDYLSELRAGVQTIRDALSLYRERKARKGDPPDELERKLEQAEQQLKLAEVGAATELGYGLCRRHWPPGIQVDESYRNSDGIRVTKMQCLECGFVSEWTTPLAPREVRPRL